MTFHVYDYNKKIDKNKKEFVRFDKTTAKHSF